MIGPCLVRFPRREGNPWAQSKFKCLTCCFHSNLLRSPYTLACKQAGTNPFEGDEIRIQSLQTRMSNS